LDIIDNDYFLAFVDAEVNNIDSDSGIYVNIDNYNAAFNVVKYLVGLGHTDIGIITGNLDKLSGKKRLSGFKAAFSSYGLELNEDLIADGNFMEMSGYEGMKKILSSEKKPTAVFVCNDTMAIGAYKAIAESGLKIPDDISIVGFDNAQYSPHMSPPLTTVNVSLPEVAKITANLLIESIENDKITLVQNLVASSIVERGSCKSIQGSFCDSTF
jgi:LacI family transcriptional regulator